MARRPSDDCKTFAQAIQAELKCAEKDRPVRLHLLINGDELLAIHYYDDVMGEDYFEAELELIKSQEQPEKYSIYKGRIFAVETQNGAKVRVRYDAIALWTEG